MRNDLLNENNWLKKELRRIELIRKQIPEDQYNTLDKPIDKADVMSQTARPHKFSPQDGQTWSSYVDQLAIYVKFAEEKNISTHINGPRRAWYTHRSSSSCFMCEDIDLHHVMLSVLRSMSESHPNSIF